MKKIFKQKNKGFTLVELLATIVVLSLVVGITVFTVTRYINKSREKTYLATVTNVEKEVGDYLLENKERLFFVTDTNNSDKEYQCLTVQNLIDYGYFSDDVLESMVGKDRKVSKDDYIYIERDRKSLAVTKTKYLLDNQELMDACNVAVTAEGDIYFSVSPSLNTWSKSKEVTINYKIRNLNDVNKLNNYTYDYAYGSNNKTGTMSLEGNQEKITVNSNGTLTANIKNLQEKIVSKNLIVKNIDTTNPSIEIDKTSDKTSSLKKSIKITLVDNESGLKRGAVLEYGFSTSNNVEPTKYEKASLNYTNGAKKVNYTINKTGLNGKYYLWIKVKSDDVAGNNLTYSNKYGEYNFIYKFMVTINKGDGISSVTNSSEHIVGEKVTISAEVAEFYKWDNWSGYVNSNDQTYTFTMPDHAIEFTANAKAYKCSTGTLQNDSSKGYICITGASSSTTEYCYDYCWNCGYATGGPGDSYEECCATNCSYSTSYYCPDSWQSYSNQRCYRNATID